MVRSLQGSSPKERPRLDAVADRAALRFGLWGVDVIDPVGFARQGPRGEQLFVVC